MINAKSAFSIFTALAHVLLFSEGKQMGGLTTESFVLVYQNWQIKGNITDYPFRHYSRFHLLFSFSFETFECSYRNHSTLGF